MASKKEKISNEIPELNLGPIMNMVVILIPLLLLSVVFTEVGVINITAPKLAMGPATEKPQDEEKQPLNLTVTIQDNGLSLMYHGEPQAPITGCPTDQGAATICLLDNQKSAQQALEQAVVKLKGSNDSKKEGAEDIKKAVNLYNWREFYNQLAALKEKYPDETVINLTAEPTMPYSVIIRAMDVSRYMLEKKSYSSRDDFWKAEYQKAGDTYAPLFPDPVLNLAK